MTARGTKGETKPRLNIYLTHELRLWVRQQALLTGTSASEYVARLLTLHRAVRVAEAAAARKD